MSRGFGGAPPRKKKQKTTPPPKKKLYLGDYGKAVCMFICSRSDSILSHCYSPQSDGWDRVFDAVADVSSSLCQTQSLPQDWQEDPWGLDPWGLDPSFLSPASGSLRD